MSSSMRERKMKKLREKQRRKQRIPGPPPHPAVMVSLNFIGKGLGILAYAPINKTLLLLQTDKFIKDPKNLNAIQTLIDQYKTNGFQNLFSGSLIKIIFNFPIEILNIYYKQLIFSKTNLAPKNANFFLRLSNWMLTGALYDGGVLMLQTPVEVISTKMALGFEGSTFSLIKKIFSEEGISGFYEGILDIFVGKCLETLFGFMYVEIFNQFQVRDHSKIHIAQSLMEMLTLSLKYPFSTLAACRMNKLEAPDVFDLKSIFGDLSKLYGGFIPTFAILHVPSAFRIMISLAIQRSRA